MTMESNNSINLKGFQLYQASLTSSTNITSNLLLTEVWNKHVKQFDNQALELPNNRNNTLTWKSSLSMLKDPEELFQKSIPPCSSCSNTITALDIDKITKNTCKCDPSVIKEIIKEDKHKGIQKTFVLSDDSDDDQKFKPTFRPPKLKRNISAPQQLNEKPPNYRVPKEMEYDIDVVDEDKAHASNVSKLIFKTAKDQFLSSNPAAKRTLKASRRAQAKFVSPMLTQEKPPKAMDIDRFKHLDPKMVELIESEIIDKGSPVAWEDIAGLEMAKSVIQEAVVWPLLRPDIFTGLRRPPKGVLLFGPPGTGKTLIGKCVASQCNATFFNISASSLTSKWIGDGEKMVRALFSVARCHQPAVIFIDEIDSILTQRSDGEHEASRRIKTEFLVQFDGAATAEEDSFLIIGATNRPQELDEAARRRLVKRLYIPLPDLNARKQIVTNLLQNEKHEIEEGDIEELSALTQGYSGADMKSLCSEAAMGPIRCVPLSQMVTIQKDNMRPVNFMDFKNALDRVKPSVSQDDLGQYVKWNNTFGQGF